jgi:molybdopterin-guanine dinucleotide biosynthesis protein A
MRRAGFVLAGGQSSRMGQDKARLVWNSHFLIEDVAAKVSNVAGNVALVGQPGRYVDLNLECLPDLHPGLGPLAGIEAALASGRGDLNLILACDMPDVELAWLENLFDTAGRTGALCVVTRENNGTVHPLCSVYRATCLDAVRARIESRRLKLTEFIQDLNPYFLETREPICNINTPDDWTKIIHGRRRLSPLH